MAIFASVPVKNPPHYAQSCMACLRAYIAPYIYALPLSVCMTRTQIPINDDPDVMILTKDKKIDSGFMLIMMIKFEYLLLHHTTIT